MGTLRLRGCWIVAAVLSLSLPVMAFQDYEVVTVTGEGLSEDSARRDALRKALEKGGGTEISSRSHVENFTLIRDTIFTRADGIVTHYDILDQGEAVGGTNYCKIRAKVSKSAIASNWGEVQNVLEQIGQPGIMVYVRERIDGVLQDASIVESQIENRLLKTGFSLFSRRQLDAIVEREMADAVAEDNVAKMQAIAKNFPTQIFITGSADANMAGSKSLYGERAAMYNADGVIKMFYTDSGQLIASEPLTNCRGGSRTQFIDSHQAGKKALQECAVELVERCYWDAMESWATRISAGGMLTLEIEGLDIGGSVKIKKMLSAIDRDKIRNVNRSFSKGIATYRIKAKMTAEDLLEHLIQDEWTALIKITDQQGNRIQAKWIGG